MRFTRTDEQQDMVEALRNLLDSADVPTVARNWSAGDSGAWWEVWKSLTDMGVAGLTAPEQSGGMHLGPVELVGCLEQLGYAGLPGPLVESIAVLPRLLTTMPEQLSWLQRSVTGRSLVTVSFTEHLRYALDADQADVVFVCDDEWVSVVENSRLVRQESVDPARRLFTVEATEATSVFAGEATVRNAFDHGALGCAAQLLGIGRRLLDISTHYVCQRHQFGRPLGEFQAIKHHLANALLKLEFARPVLHGACLSASAAARYGPRDISAAKVTAGDAAYTAARIALQVHGAIGYTAENDLHLWLTKATALRSAWGTPSWHRRRIAEALHEDPSVPLGGSQDP